MRTATTTCAWALALLGTAVALSAPATGATKPVTGSVSGPVVSVKGSTFTLTTSLSPTGRSTVAVGSKTAITEQLAGTIADVKTGMCVAAIGQKAKNGTVTATRVTLTQPVKGQCAGGFGPRPGGGRPSGGAPPSGNRSGRPPGGFGGGGANFGFAFGKVTAAKSGTITVKGSQGSTKVSLAKKTQVSKTERVGRAAIVVKLCAFVRGTSGDRGVTVTATDISLSKPVAGACTGRFTR